ncbi:MAG: hypothetical protein FD123_1286 [Bacteroidetes bacterium]|nr:MAG: hypothetical protein FD123_1286 [Bacteroidota bacterium]
MKASSEIHQLIRSMSMSEKRHFKIHASRHVIGNENLYPQLFDAIARQESYDEDAIRRHFGETAFGKNIASGKNYLYQQVLESLNVYNRDKTFLSRYANILVSIENLYNRGLFSQCHKLIRRSKTEAYSLEKFSILLILLRWETIIHIKDEDERKLNRSMMEELRVTEMMRVQSALMRVAFNIQIQIDKGVRSADFIRENEKELKKNLPASPEVDSFWAKYYYYSSKGLLCSIQGKQEERYQCYKEIKKLMDEAPQFIRDLPGIYHLNLNNLFNVMMFLGKYKEGEALIRQQEEFMPAYDIKRPALSKIVFLNTCDNELYLFYKTGRFDDAAGLTRHIEHEVRAFRINFSPLLFDLMFMMAVSELMVGNYKNAQKWLNKIINSERDVYFRKELQINSRLLYLVVLYDSDDLLLDNRITATRRFMQQEKQFHAQKKILESIRLLSDGASSRKNKNALLKLSSDIRKDMTKSFSEANNKQFDFSEWIDRKVKAVLG